MIKELVIKNRSVRRYDDIKYYRRNGDVHVVPKRPLSEVLVIEK